MAAGKALTPTEYIQHHLTFFTKPVGDGGFWTLHVDSLDGAARRCSWASASSGGWCAERPPACRTSARRSSNSSLRVHRRPGQGGFPPRRPQPLRRSAALTVFIWVLLMNAMDFLPVDIMAAMLGAVGLHEWRLVPTADVNTTFALALSVWLLMIFFSIAVKGLGGWIHELFCAPFGVNPGAAPFPWCSIPVQHDRIRFEAAIALAAAVRQHVRGRDHLPAAVAVGGERPGRARSSRCRSRSAGRSSTS